MNATLRVSWLGASLAAALFGSGLGSVQAQEANSSTSGSVHIGIVRSLFRDAPEPLVRALTQPLGLLMKVETGMTGVLTTDDNALKLGKDLAEGKVQIGVFQGIEFAWAKQQYPALKPLVLVTDGKPFRRAYLVVSRKSTIHNFADVGGAVAMPLFSHEQCYEFVKHCCRQERINAKQVLARLTRPENAEDALDDVVDGHSPAVIVEEMALECYRQRKPGRYQSLRIALKSPVFPASVVAYRPGGLSPRILRLFRTALLGASQKPIGRQLLTLWRVTDFEPVPADYEQSLKTIVKEYPPPQPRRSHELAGR